MTIQSIINNAVKRLRLEGKLLTPDFYAEAFCKEALKAKMSVEDCCHLDKFTKTLNKEFQREVKDYRIKTMNELVRFLISKLNRTNPTLCTQTLESHILFSKKILQVIEVLHNKEASELAVNCIDLINSNAQHDQIDLFRQRWSNFISTYDDTFLRSLNTIGKVDTKDLRKSVESLHASKSTAESKNIDLEKISRLLVSSFVPSIASSMNDTISQLSKKILNNPDMLQVNTIEQDIRSAISLRISLDKESVRDMVESIDGVLDKLSMRLIHMIEDSHSTNTEIQNIKKELESYTEESTPNFKVAHKKLYTIAIALEENTEVLSKELKGHSKEVKSLSEKITLLEKELKETKQESKEDFLTKLYNKRALEELMDIKEAEFERSTHNFSIIMFDLDHFKGVNDTYGHEAGDAILSSFAKVLKKECRTVDIVGRFGGEEFLVLLSETDTEGGVIFAEKVRNLVEKSRFMYQGKRIKVTCSCGVSQRAKNPSLQTTINSADKCMYEAKNSGRNRVEHSK